jgi:hypothetical protein
MSADHLCAALASLADAANEGGLTAEQVSAHLRPGCAKHATDLCTLGLHLGGLSAKACMHARTRTHTHTHTHLGA